MTSTIISHSKEIEALHNEERIMTKLRALYDEELLKDLNQRKTNRRNNAQKQLIEAKELIHRVIVDDLSNEWLKLVEAGTPQQHKARHLLIDQVLPAIIVGLMKLLSEVDKRNLVTNFDEPNFNPINFLAQFLMRNNPKHEVFPEQNPYICGMRQVAIKLSAKVPTQEQLQLQDMRAQIERRKNEISMAKLAKASEFDQRVGALSGQFPDWGIANTDGVVQSALVEGALKVFAERYQESLLEMYQNRAQTFFSALAERIKLSGLNVADYSNILAKRTIQMTSEVFQLFLAHMTSCANIYRKAVDNRRNIDSLGDIFNRLDAHREGRISRDKVMEALTRLYDSAPSGKQVLLLRPSEWPICAPEDDLTAEEIISLEVEVPCSDMFEAPPDPEVVVEPEHGEPGEEGATEDAGDTAREGAEEAPVDGTAEATGTEEPADIPTDEMIQNAGATLEKAPEAQEAVVDYSVVLETHDEAKLVTAALTIEPQSGDVSKSQLPEDNLGGISAPLKRPDALPVMEIKPPLPSAPQLRPPQATSTQIGTVIEDDETAEDEDTLADLPQHATVNRLLSVAPKKLEGFDDSTLTQQQFLQTVQNFVMPAIVAADDAEEAKRQPKQVPQDLFGMLGSSESEQPSAIQSDEEPPSTVDYQVEAEMVMRQLGKSLVSGFIETDHEVSARLREAKRASTLKAKYERLDKLFDRWDNEGQGVIDLDEIENLLARYKHGQESAAVRQAISTFMSNDPVHADRRLTRAEFRQLIVGITDALPGPDESFEYLVTFMNNNLKMSLVEQLRGSCRRRWLAEVQTAILTAGLSLENVFRAAFQAIYKDAELHGDRKQINVYVALAERVPEHERMQHGDGMCLRYVAATPKDAPIVLNKRLYRDMPGVSLSVLETGRPIHVPRVAAHGNVHFWNAGRPASDRDGSFLALPLKETSRKQCFGILAVDTIGDPQNMGGVAGGSFAPHEIKFYQGVAAALADAFRVVQFAVDVTDQLARAVPLIFQQVSPILQCAVYLTELDPRTSWTMSDKNSGDDIVLRKVVEADRLKLKTEQIGNQPARLVREQNLFREYVFNAAATGTTVVKKSYGERRLAVPLRRPSDGKTIAVFDMGVRDAGKEHRVVLADGTAEMRAPPLISSEQRIRMVRVLKVVQAAVGELSMEFLTQSDGQTVANPKILHAPGGAEPLQLVVEKQEVANQAKLKKALLLDRNMLAFHRARISRYPEADVFSDLKSIGKPNNELIVKFTSLLVGLAYPKYLARGDYAGDWLKCKVYLSSEMHERLLVLDPSHPRIAQFIVKRITPELPSYEELRSILVTSRLELLYEFLQTCLSIASTCVVFGVQANEFSSPAVSLDTPLASNYDISNV